jgi:hypothetical protein
MKYKNSQKKSIFEQDYICYVNTFTDKVKTL